MPEQKPGDIQSAFEQLLAEESPTESDAVPQYVAPDKSVAEVGRKPDDSAPTPVDISDDLTRPVFTDDQVRAKAKEIIVSGKTLHSAEMADEMRSLIRALLAKIACIPSSQGLHIQTPSSKPTKSKARNSELTDAKVRSEALGLISTGTTLDSVGLHIDVKKQIRKLLLAILDITTEGNTAEPNATQNQLPPKFLHLVDSSKVAEPTGSGDITIKL